MSSLGDGMELSGEQNAAEGAPRGRLGAGLAFDRGRSELVYFGGTDGANYVQDTWYWNGLSWQEDPSMGPTGRAYFGVAFDPTRRQLLIFGGLDDGGVLQETWVRF